MSGMADLAIIVLAGLIHAMLQLGVGAMLTLYHAILGGKVKAKARTLGRNYMLGAGLFNMLTVAACCFVVLVIFSGAMPEPAVIIMCGVLMILAAGIWFLYYRKSEGTELWVPRSFAKFIGERAEETDDNVEAFSLGMTMAAGEMPFAIALVIMAVNSILALPQSTQIMAIMLYVAMAEIPMIVLQVAVRNGKTVVEIQRWRVRNKNFLKIMAGVCYVVLAIFVFMFKVMK
ncbi:MAG: hypothetical protein Q4F60_02195 [Candidatus Saccharibacteria bacterium]|nr:hypothetical protein [Candidatus Saccharibacteria bacterium]